jgi:hypothetical protein
LKKQGAVERIEGRTVNRRSQREQSTIEKQRAVEGNIGK